VTNGQRANDYENLEAFRSHVFEGLLVHNIFSTLVLPAMLQMVDSGCPLAVLNQGAETACVYKKRLAEYLDVPTGKKLCLHLQALHNLDKVLDDADDESERIGDSQVPPWPACDQDDMPGSRNYNK